MVRNGSKKNISTKKINVTKSVKPKIIIKSMDFKSKIDEMRSKQQNVI